MIYVGAVSNNLLNLYARFEPELPEDEVKVELIGRTFPLGPRASLGMGGLPIGTHTVTVTDVDPDLLELTDVQCEHLDGDALEWEADLDAGAMRITLDADDVTRCGLFFSAPTYTITIEVVGDPADLDGDLGFTIDGLDPLTVPVGSSETVELRVRPDGESAAIVLSDADGLLPASVACTTPDGPPEGITTEGTRRAELALSADTTATCTFHVGEVPPVTVVAMVVTDPPFVEGKIDVEMAGVTVALGHAEYATDRNANANRYPLIVDPDPEFELRSLSCFDAAGSAVAATQGDDPGAVILDPSDDETTCTIVVSPRVATVRLTVDAGDEPVETEFTLELGAERVELLPGELATDPNADPDLYRAALVPDAGFRLDDIVCIGADGERLNADVVFENQSIAFAPGLGATVDCTFLLSPRTGEVQVVVTADQLLPNTEFTLELGAEVATVASGVTATDDDARAGTYHVALQPVSRYRLLDIDCRDEARERIAANFVPESLANSFALPIGGTVRCEFVVQALVATVTALVDDGAAQGTNSYELDMFGEITPVASQVEAIDEEGDSAGYSIALLPHDGPQLTNIDCRDSGGERISADIRGENRSVSFVPGIGSETRCVFVLGDGRDHDGSIGSGGSVGPGSDPTEEPPPDATAAPVERLLLRAGRWRAVNAATAIQCAGISTPLPRTTDNGRIAVKQGGARIVATGLGDGAKIVLDQVEGKPGLYRGTVKVKSQGVTMPLKYEMRVLDPEHIEGKLRADFKAAGQECVLKRDFTIDFRGE